MIGNNEIQAALLAYLKTLTSVTAYVHAIEIREDQYQGTEFTYPNIRIRMIDNSPLTDSNCITQKFSVSIMVFGESSSSKETDKIAGIISTELHRKHFTSNTLTFATRVTNIMPSIRSDIRTWRSEVLVSGIVV